MRLMSQKSWWYRPLTIADLGIYGADEIQKINPVEVAEIKKKLGFNTEHLTCSDVYGGEKGVFYFKTKIAKKVPRDFLSEYLPEAHKREIKVLVYYNVHWINVNFGKEHPDWLQVNSEGKTIDNLYGSGNAPCVNSPSWREWSLQGIKDLASYDIDGIFLDGPIFVPGACYCKNCQKAFKHAYDLELPRKEDWKDPVWRKFIEFRYNSIATYLRDARTALKEVRPEAVIYMNCTGLWPAWPAARDNRRLMPYQDLLGAEGGFLYYDLRSEPLWKPGMTAKLIETQAEGKPTVVFIAGANKGWDEYILTPAETKLLYADTLANGANPWYGIPLSKTDRPGALAAGEMNMFIQRNAEYLERTTPLAKVALFWSSMTADYYRASVPVTDFTPQGEKLEKKEAAGNFYASFLGCYEALVRSHVPFVVLDEEALKFETLKNYDLLIAPNCACISKDKAEVIMNYVKNGGNLIASFETSRYDEYGNPLDDFRLSEVFGVKVGRGVFGPMKLDYISIVEKHPILENLSTSLLPSPVYGVEVFPTTSKVLAMYHKKMPARYVKIPPLSNNPVFLINEYGNGKSFYIAGNFFEHYYNYHNPDYRKILANATSLMARKLITLENCPRSVEVTLRQQLNNRRLIVHLVNFTGEMTRPIESIVPIRNIKITVHGFSELRYAKALWLKESLSVEQKSQEVTFTLPLLKEYEIVSLE